MPQLKQPGILAGTVRRICRVLGAFLVRVCMDMVVVAIHDEWVVREHLGSMMVIPVVVSMMVVVVAMAPFVRMRVNIVVVTIYNDRIVRIHLGSVAMVAAVVSVVPMGPLVHTRTRARGRMLRRLVALVLDAGWKTKD